MRELRAPVLDVDGLVKAVIARVLRSGKSLSGVWGLSLGTYVVVLFGICPVFYATW